MRLLILTSPESSRKGVLLEERGGHTARCEKNPFMEKESLVQAAIEFSAVCGGTTKALESRPGGVQVKGRWTSDGSSVFLCFVLIPDLQFHDLSIFFVHDRRKILNSYWFYNILEPRTPLFFLFLLFHFLSWAIFKHHKFSLGVPIIRDRHDLHLHDLSSHFLSPTTKFLISYCSLQHFYELGTSKINSFFDFFTCSRERVFKSWAFFWFSYHYCSYMIFIFMMSQRSKKTNRIKKQRENVARCGFWISLVFIRFSYIIVPHQIFIKNNDEHERCDL